MDPTKKQTSQSPELSKAKIKTGKTIEPNSLMQVNIKKMNEKKEQDDIFGTMSKLKLGPGQYDPVVDLTKNKSPELQFVSNTAQKAPDEEKTMQQ